MRSRDVLLDRMERKLQEKEKEVRELREYLDGKIAYYVRDFLETVFDDVALKLESRIRDIELTLQSLADEIAILRRDIKNAGIENRTGVNRAGVNRADTPRNHNRDDNLLNKLKTVVREEDDLEKEVSKKTEFIIAECEYRSRKKNSAGAEEDLIICE